MQPNEMAVCLRRGLGRVIFFLQSQNGHAEKFRDVILHACLYDVRYDRQCEDHRAPYLLEIAKATGEPDWYSAQVCDALNQSAAEDETDENQWCELAGLWAKNGNQTARAALYMAFARSRGQGEDIGAQEIIDLDGAAGFNRVLESYHDKTPVNEDDVFDSFYIDRLIESLGGESEARQATTNIAQSTLHLAPTLDELWNEWEQRQRHRAERRAKPELPSPTWSDIQTALDDVARASGKYIYRPFLRWGRIASGEILQKAAAEIAAGASGESLRGLLQLFEKHPFPLDPAVVLPHTLSDIRRISYHAVSALEHTAHPDVRAWGLEFIHTGRMSDGVMLLTSNPSPSDAALFMQMLQTPMTEMELHHVGISLRDYYETNPSPELFPVLLYLYENGPCSICRASVVKLLIDADALPAALRDECRYDADEGTREMGAA